MAYIIQHIEKKIVILLEIVFLYEVQDWTIINDINHIIKYKRIRIFAGLANPKDQLLHNVKASIIDTLLWKK